MILIPEKFALNWNISFYWTGTVEIQNPVHEPIEHCHVSGVSEGLAEQGRIEGR